MQLIIILPPNVNIQILIITRRCQPVLLYPHPLRLVYSPPIGHMWLSLTPSSELITTNIPINTQHVETKTNTIKSKITYTHP
jgi:hypothetical protein